MSVSGIPPQPAGFDVLFPSGNVPGTSATPPAAAAPAQATTPPAPTTNLSSSVPGSDALTSSFNGSTVPGFDILQPAQYFPGATASSSTPSTTPSTTAPQTVKQQYDAFEQSVTATLYASVEGGVPSTLPTYADGSSASSFSQLSDTLAAIKPLIAIEQTEQQGSSKPATGSNVNALA